MSRENEQIYYDALKTIARRYDSPERIRRNAERQYGLEYVEALEMAYENIQATAERAIKGKRAPNWVSPKTRREAAAAMLADMQGGADD